MDQGIDDGAVTGHGVGLIAVDGQHAGLALEWFSEHAAGPAGGGGIGFARTDDDRGQPRGASVEVAFSGVVVDEHFANGLGHAVSGLGELLGEIRHFPAHIHATIAGDAAGENHAWQSRAFPRSFKNMTPAIEVHAQCIIETFLAFSADHGGQMENYRGWVRADGGKDGVAVANVACDLPCSRICGGFVKQCVQQNNFFNRLSTERGAQEQLIAESGAEESAAAGDDDFHGC